MPSITTAPHKVAPTAEKAVARATRVSTMIGKSGLVAFLARRIGHVVVVVLAATVIVFLLMQALGDPVAAMLPLGTSNDQIQAVRETLGLNDPLIVQYWRFISHAVRGDFGTSLWLGTPAFRSAVDTVPKTFMLVVPASIIGVGLGSILGMRAGSRPGSVIDRIVTSVSFFMISIAEFWLGLMLIYVFAARLGWVYSGGYGTDLKHIALPIVVLTIRPFAHAIQVMRASVIQEQRTAYVMTARSRGASERRILFRHILPNASLAVIAVAFYDLSRLFVAGTIVEVVFTWPGLGRLAVNALQHGDIPLIEAAVVMAAAIVSILNLIGDLVVFKLDPRTRDALGGKSS